MSYLQLINKAFKDSEEKEKEKSITFELTWLLLIGGADVNDYRDGDIVIGAFKESPGSPIFACRAYIFKIESPPTSANELLWCIYE